MSQFTNLYKQFNESIVEVVNVWRTQQSELNDPKINQIGHEVLKPISDLSGELNFLFDEMNQITKKLQSMDIADDI